MALSNNLKEARLKKGLTQEELAKLVGKSKNVISNWERGDNKPDADTLFLLCDILNVDANFLLGWENNQNLSLSLKEQDYIKKYRDLDDHGKDLVDTVLLKEHERCIKEQETIYVPKRYIDKLPNIASAGIGDYLFDDIPFEKIEVDENCQADFAIGIDGDSMEPTYSHNDAVLVKKQDTINVGEIGIFIVDGECFIKEYAKDRLISHNKNYPDKEFDENMDIRLVGKVIGKLEG